MPTFKLTWTIDAEGTDALDAARRVATDYFQARIAQGHPDTACVFQLTDHEGQAVTIDLSAHRIHLECAHAAECERLRAMLTNWEADANLLEKERDEARAELSALKAQQEKPKAEVCMGCVEQASRIRELEHKMDYYKAQQVGQEPQRCQCCGYLVTESEHRGCLRAAAPQPAPAQDVAGLVEAAKKADDALSALVRNDQPLETLARKYGSDWSSAIDKVRTELVIQIAAHDKQSREKKS